MLYRSVSKILLLFLLIFTLPMQAQTPAALECPAGYLRSRLTSGIRAGVINTGLPNNLRQGPSTRAARSGQIDPGGTFTVLAGPTCAEGYVWWQVNYRGEIGWTAEGDPNSATYWLEPLSAPLAISAITADDLAGCQPPPEDYTRSLIGAADFNARTLAMLDHAQTLYNLYGGTNVVFRQAITQGGYNGGYVAASFGTHDGGGAVDISVRNRGDFRVLRDDIPLMLRALRVAGFAAWLREVDELYPGSPIHIHAVAIGDAELSPAAQEQIDGAFGYFRGYNGLPQDSGIPLPDTSGEPVLCAWMAEMGYSDLRAEVE